MDHNHVTHLRAMVAKHYCSPEDEIVDSTSFETDLRGDSLDTVEFSMHVEEEFGIELSDSEADDALGLGGTFGKLCQLVDAKLAVKAQAA